MQGYQIADRFACGFGGIGILILIIAIIINLNDLLVIGAILFIFGFMCCMIGRSHKEWAKKHTKQAKIVPMIILTQTTNDHVCLTIKDKVNTDS